MTFDYFKGVKVAWTANNKITIAGEDDTKYFTVGRRVKVEGFKLPENNGYFQIASVALVGTATEITVTTTTSVAEAGSNATKVLDANDVIVMNSTALRLGTGAASTIDSNGGNLFASAIAAEQLVFGQKVFLDLPVSAVTFDSFAVTFTGAATALDTLIINDGKNVKSFVAGKDYVPGADESATAAALVTAINSARAKGDIEAKASAAAGVLTIFILTNNPLAVVVDSIDSGTVATVGARVPATAPTARGFYTIVGLSDDALTLDPQVPTVAAPGVTSVKASMLRNPGAVEDITPQSFVLETAFNDVGLQFIQNGMRVGTYSLDVSTGAIVTGTMAFQGKETTTLTGTKLGAAPYDVLDTTATEVMNATTNVGNLTKNGLELSTAVQSITLEGDASLRNQNAVGSKFPRGIGTGRFNLTGTITAYFETLEMYNHFVDHDTVSIGFDFSDLDGNVYFYTIPAIKLTSDPVNPTGIDQDVMEEIEWSALRDAATKCMIQIDRFSSVFPI